MMGIRTYADTSVFGGVFDEEFEEPSRAFFDLVRSGKFSLAVSDVSAAEIEGAPREVRDFFEALLPHMHVVAIDAAVQGLRDAYIAAGVVGERSVDDAAHVAAAVVAGCELIVSWNFRHIVHFEKIRGYNEVGVRQGFNEVEIRSPREVLSYEDDEEI